MASNCQSRDAKRLLPASTNPGSSPKSYSRHPGVISRLPYWALPLVLSGIIFLVVLLLPSNATRSHRMSISSSPADLLKFTTDGTFQISIFEDLHFGENAWEQWGPQQDLNTIKVMDTVLNAESPQLVVMDGDLITGENSFLENSTDYIDMMVRPMVQRNLSWASTYGNHDSNFNLSREGILAHERRYPQARTTQMMYGRDAGVSNYYLPVYSSDDSVCPLLLLWFFDSRGGSYFQETDADGNAVEQPNWVDQSVVDWFEPTRDRLTAQYGRTIPSLAFVHIPTNASRAFQTSVGPHPLYEPGVNDDYPLAQQSQGWCLGGSQKKSCRYGGQDVPFMQAIASTPGLIGLFSGHDHGDTWCYKWDETLPGVDFSGNGVNLCFGQHSGYGGYGRWIRGARQILVTEEMLRHQEVETWIRLEDESVAGAVTLNATYGHDRYEKTPNKHTKCPTCD